MNMVYLEGSLRLDVDSDIGKKIFKEDSIFSVDGSVLVNLIGNLNNRIGIGKIDFSIERTFINSEEFISSLFSIYEDHDFSLPNVFYSQLSNALRYCFYSDIPICILNAEVINLETEYISNPNRANHFDLNSMYRDVKARINTIKSATIYGMDRDDFPPVSIEPILQKIKYEIVPY